jgi:hypothetical protein
VASWRATTGGVVGRLNLSIAGRIREVATEATG